MTAAHWAAAPITHKEACAALDEAVAQVLVNLPLYTHHCQNHSTVHGIYPICDNVQWSCGFWPGEIWLSYERTGDGVFRQAAAELVDSFARRCAGQGAADAAGMGLLYTPSCVAAYRLTGNETAKKTALLAAEHLLHRLCAEEGCRQAGGGQDGQEFWSGSLLDLPLLDWAAHTTGREEYAAAAQRHAAACLTALFRPAGPVVFRGENGVPEVGCKGGLWARGQAWGLYGSILCYSAGRGRQYLAAFQRLARLYLTRLPQDLVPYWDMTFTSGREEPRDSSAATIAACGLLEAARCLPAGEGAEYEILARRMLKSLATAYAVKEHRLGFGQLLHGTYRKRGLYGTGMSDGVDECTAWGDYFYLEALTRLTSCWSPYWQSGRHSPAPARGERRTQNS